jgi:predicted flap endonuclease-1-like 5' DNA nuclease
MAKKIEDIEGIGPAYGEKLRKAGVASPGTLLKEGCTKKGRDSLSEKTGLDAGQILKFVNMADLFRVKGIAGQFAELLKASGVDTVKELRTRNAANLVVKMAEVNAAKKLCKVSPSEKMVEGWIEQAKELPPMVTY